MIFLGGIFLKNIERGSIKHLLLLILSYTITAIIVFPLFDLILFKFITHTSFEYTVYEYIIKPLIFGIILGTIMWVIDNKKRK